MEFVNALKKRRTYYSINRSLPVSEEKIIETVQEVTEAKPDAFNMKSARGVIAIGQKQDA